MGILDKYQSVLAIDVWDAVTKKMIPQVREQILMNLGKLVSLDHVKEAHVIGAITGYQYKETTDIDINVALDTPELVESLWEIRRKHNGIPAIGTRHPINYFLIPWKGEDQSWSDSPFGIYNLLDDSWIVVPTTRTDPREPEDQYRLELSVAKIFGIHFMKMVDSYLDNLEKYRKWKTVMEDGWEKEWHLKRKRAEIEEDFKDLTAFCTDFDRNRKFEYSWGWGIPRTNFRNIVFKYVAGNLPGRYSEIFEDLLAVKIEDQLTKARVIYERPAL